MNRISQTIRLTAIAALALVTAASCVLVVTPTTDDTNEFTDLTLNVTAENQDIAAGAKSYYEFTTTTAGTYTIKVGEFSGDLEWDLYNTAEAARAGDDTPVAEGPGGQTKPEQTDATLSAAQTYYLVIINGSSINADTFAVTILPPS